MKKIISLFQRNYTTDNLVRDEITPGAEWVVDGEGVATIKWDGTCCLIRGGKLFKRYDAKHGKKPPADFEPAQEPDPKTGHWPGWVPVGDGPNDQWHRQAFAPHADGVVTLEDGTYELVGPKIGINPHQLQSHIFIRHGIAKADAPRTFAELKAWFATQDIEGLVWHHPDGRMVKIKKRDFGLKWR